jgi:hypothetical protein
MYKHKKNISVSQIYKYSHVACNNILVKCGLHMWQWSHETTVELESSCPPVTS